VLYIVLKINFLLIQRLYQISKRLYGESIPCDYLRTAPLLQKHTNIFQTSRGVTKVRNSNKINHLPLKIFIWLQSQESQLHNKCLFCSIKSLIISLKLNFVGVWCSVIHKLKRWSKQADKYILIVPVTFAETCQTMFIINPQVVSCLNNQ
jgi:hypothetical protein